VATQMSKGLSPESLGWFGLAENPFAADDERFYARVTPHERAVRDCLQTVTQQIGMGLVLGAPGAGKSMVASRLEAVLVRDGAARQFLPYRVDGGRLGTTSDRLLRGLCAALGASKRVPAYKLYDTIEANALKLFEAGRVPVLLIDRAEALEREVLQSLVFLWNLVTPCASHFLVRIVLFARPTLVGRLDAPRFAALRSRITLTTPELPALDEASMAAVVVERVAAAGGPSDLFDAAALRALHADSRGNPGAALRLATRSLETAFARRERTVTVGAVDHANGKGSILVA
jgi:type II secretory pathway predicted ATPase ExeA